MLSLVTDRTQYNVDRRNHLADLGWSKMTAEEQAEWTGDPFMALNGANLIPPGENYGAGVTVYQDGDAITVTSLWDGSYIYGILIIGPAANYEGKTFTLSLESFYSSGGGTAQAALYWHDANGYEYAGGVLTGTGIATFTTTENTGGRSNLVLYLYAATDTAITAGAYIRYERLMLEPGSVKHDYVPYYEILPTNATKGAYNFSDLNRVERACQVLAGEYGLSLTVKTDWGMWDLPKASDLARIIGNLQELRTRATVLPNTPAVPGSMNRMTYTTANQIEQFLFDINKIAASIFRCGELYCGEG